MRLRKGCKRCRDRHTKCLVHPGQTACHTCVQSNSECLFEPHFQFRTGWDDDEERGTDATWTEDQTWVSTNAPLRYIFEDGTGLQMDPPWTPVSLINTPSSTGMGPTPSNPTTSYPLSPPKRGLSISRLVDAEPTPTFDQGTHFQRPPSLGPRDSFNASHHSHSFPTSRRAQHSIKPDASETELLLDYARLLAPWCDSNDPAQTFANEVPCRALQIPMLFYAIMSLTSLRKAIPINASRQESEDYHAKCVPLVISALSSPSASQDVDLLVTISILRQLEELSDLDDSPTHLNGANEMFTEASRFASSGGLAEAASWQTLRQFISAAIVGRHPLQISLTDYERSSIATSRSNGPYANAAVLLCAKALQSQDDGWAELEYDIERWYDERPLAFQPVYQVDETPAGGNPWPTLSMLGEPQVMGMQYYHISKILVLCHKPTLNLTGFEGMKAQARLEKMIQRNLLNVIGLSTSNHRYEGAKFAACHMLNFCGYTLSTVLQREHAILFLEHVASTMGWATRKTIKLLKEQWSDLDPARVY